MTFWSLICAQTLLWLWLLIIILWLIYLFLKCFSIDAMKGYFWTKQYHPFSLGCRKISTPTSKWSISSGCRNTSSPIVQLVATLPWAWLATEMVSLSKQWSIHSKTSHVHKMNMHAWFAITAKVWSLFYEPFKTWGFTCMRKQWVLFKEGRGGLGTELGLQQLFVWYHQPLQAKWLVWITWLLAAYCNQTSPWKRKHQITSLLAYNVYIVIAMVTTLK